MAQYRFRTAAIVGEWRPSRAQACDDALKTRQAQPDGRNRDGVAWRVPGMIEMDPLTLH
jgi:hypothetical protein